MYHSNRNKLTAIQKLDIIQNVNGLSAYMLSIKYSVSLNLVRAIIKSHSQENIKEEIKKIECPTVHKNYLHIYRKYEHSLARKNS